MSGPDDTRMWQGLRSHLDELGSLASAPPLEGVVARRPPRLLGRLRLASATAASVIALVAILGGVLLAPHQLPAAAAVGRASDGPFTLEITSTKSVYGAGEPIEISATLTYGGPEASVDISHGHLTPLGFGIVEAVNGITLAPAWRLSCESTTLVRDVRLTHGFTKSGGSSGSDPSFQAFMEDPVLRLPRGTWHVYAVASFAEGSCGGQAPRMSWVSGHGARSAPHDLRAEIVIDVGSASTRTPVAPSPTGSPPSPSADITARYPDGLPMTLNGEHVWRPVELLKAPVMPTGEFLVAAWDTGSLATSCPAQVVGRTNPPCPSFEGLADTRGGLDIVTLAWEQLPIEHAAAFVFRVAAEPNPTCVSIPAGGCPRLTLDAVEVLWAGDPPPSDGACSASQFALGLPTNSGGFGTLGTMSDYVTQPLRNVGGPCVLNLPATIKVASATGPFQTVKVVNGGIATTFSVQADQSLSIVLGAWWYVPAWLSGSGFSPPPCTAAIRNVTRAEIPLESSSLEFDLGTVWADVCSSPASVSVTVTSTPSVAPSFTSAQARSDVLATVTRFEQAIYVKHNPAPAWLSLSSFSQRAISFTDWASAMRNLAAQSGPTYQIEAPTLDWTVLNYAYVGAEESDIRASADVAYAYAVWVRHPANPSISGGSEGMIVAPLRDGSGWRIWLVH
jgi:hypothetical protein